LTAPFRSFLRNFCTLFAVSLPSWFVFLAVFAPSQK
jgi:hypothetical protein